MPYQYLPFIELTAEIVNNGIRKYIIDERLTERSYGDFEGHGYDIYPNHDDLWDYSIVDTSKIGNIESVKAFFDRIQDVINELKTKYPDGNVLLICHGGVYRAIHYLNEGFDNETNFLQLFQRYYMLYSNQKNKQRQKEPPLIYLQHFQLAEFRTHLIQNSTNLV